MDQERLNLFVRELIVVNDNYSSPRRQLEFPTDDNYPFVILGGVSFLSAPEGAEKSVNLSHLLFACVLWHFWRDNYRHPAPKYGHDAPAGQWPPR